MRDKVLVFGKRIGINLESELLFAFLSPLLWALTSVLAISAVINQNSDTLGLDSIACLRDCGSVSYPGGKNGAGVYQKIINLMPPHDVYIEPFLGSGAVMRMKRPAALNIGCDLAAGPIAHFRERVLGDLGASLSLEVVDGIEKLERIADGRLPLAGSILVYCDPPYLLSTRSGRRQYEFEMSAIDHRRLLRVCRRLDLGGICIMISGYGSRMYADALKSWDHIEFESMTRGGYTKTEHVWFNFSRPVALHDYRYLGRDFRERERIKRQKQRWAARLDRMPVLQRQALLSAIADRQIERVSPAPISRSSEGARRGAVYDETSNVFPAAVGFACARAGV